MSVRILHCGKSIENYYLCINEKVAGFARRGPTSGDTIYFVVKPEKKAYCGARAVLSEITDKRPWQDADSYPQAFTLENLEFCKPFEINILSSVGGQHWNLKYLQGAKAINDPNALDVLDRCFSEVKLDKPYIFETTRHFIFDFEEVDSDEDIELGDHAEIAEDLSESKLNIMGTFLTIKFRSEQHAVSGLETLVNENFYELFDDFPENRTLLISDNRMFKTAGITSTKNERVSGVSGIPDALLVRFDKGDSCPFQINLIEYECYGETRSKSVDKFNYLNGHIIPQLMRFASTFSVVTDGAIRDQTVRAWTQKVIDYVYSNDDVTEKVSGWIRMLYPGIREQQISLHLNHLLEQAFRTNIRVVLIIDELTPEQRDTIRNVINSFKLDAPSSSVDFAAYVVRLQQRINVINTDAEYAISVQK
ncbi:hypothetical protein DFP94_101525 [Fontibacillus phaseoli]|uniref:Uncharacterized protein n=1 Tax=Fontibacillus phaseoli TaxID=1416533 RepID=A0A369BQR1_9BACL|nr:hypothetical protein [Fontibacillus phaseoli]RCX22936.1 hypothetical protein DFP94_101525 [Fontibacillus phaseoli]